MNNLEKTIEEIEAKLEQGEIFSAKYTEKTKEAQNLKQEYISIRDENKNLKQDMHILLKKLYMNYDERELLLASVGNK